MAQYWTYGVDDQGGPQLLGPFEDQDEAQDAGAELNNVRVLYAATRTEAVAQLQRGAAPQRQQRRPEPRDAFDEDEEMSRQALRDF